jgi:predicted AAA+ superfamily ATPase
MMVTHPPMAEGDLLPSEKEAATAFYVSNLKSGCKKKLIPYPHFKECNIRILNSNIRKNETFPHYVPI